MPMRFGRALRIAATGAVAITVIGFVLYHFGPGLTSGLLFPSQVGLLLITPGWLALWWWSSTLHGLGWYVAVLISNTTVWTAVLVAALFIAYAARAPSEGPQGATTIASRVLASTLLFVAGLVAVRLFWVWSHLPHYAQASHKMTFSLAWLGIAVASVASLQLWRISSTAGRLSSLIRLALAALVVLSSAAANSWATLTSTAGA
jgi:hypothetical protein